MIRGLGQISETEKSMAEINWRDRTDTSGHDLWYQTNNACGIKGLGKTYLKKKMNNAKILGKELYYQLWWSLKDPCFPIQVLDCFL